MTPESPTRHVLSTDGVSLAVYESGEATAPTIVAVHGYPDDHTVWDGVAAVLADRFHVVTYDVRGAGASEAPRERGGYRIPQLVEDLAAVIDAVSPGERVHLVGHDWGSVQCWGAVTDLRFSGRLRSFTSISGPSLDMAAEWLRAAPAHPLAAARQLLASSYIGFFQLPVLPEAAVRAGLLDRLVARSERRRPGEAAPGRRTRRDALNGLELYRANFLGRMARPRPGKAVVPVQVLAPTRDPYITSRLQREAPGPYADVLVTHEIPAGHWVVSQQPGIVAEHLARFADYVETPPADD